MRKLDDWLTSFMDYTASMSAPKLFRQWTGLSMLSAALERKVWIETELGHLYPNLYVFLVSPPGVGKTVLTSMSIRAIKALSGHKVASSSITRATVVEELNEAERHAAGITGGASKFNSLYICSNELGTLLPAYDLEFMSKLTEIYDCHPYSERRRDRRHNAEIPRPQLNILAATQPGFLSSMLPEVAWEQGFLSRAILVYSGELIRKSLFAKSKHNDVLWEKLISDLKTIGNVAGELLFTQEAADLLDNFYMGGHKETAPNHPKLHHYNTRRPAHIMKLMQVSAMSRGDEKLLTEADFIRALDWLIEAESTIPNIFKSMQSGGDSQVLRDAWHYCFEYNARSGEGIPKEKILTFLSNRVPSEKVERILSLMESTKILRPEITAKGTSYRAAESPNTIT